jgi:hypothetical protein
MALTATMMCLFPPVVWTHYFIILFLPLCVLSHYARWWESRRSSATFFLIVASVNLRGFTLAKLSALAHTDMVFSLPTVGVLAIFTWLNVEAFKAPSTAALESKTMTAVAAERLPPSNNDRGVSEIC